LHALAAIRKGPLARILIFSIVLKLIALRCLVINDSIGTVIIGAGYASTSSRAKESEATLRPVSLMYSNFFAGDSLRKSIGKREFK
jgi:hypothetical protein